MLKWRVCAAMLAAAIMSASQAGMAQAPPQRVPVDRSVVVGGVEVACTGIGKNARDDPRWKAFPIRVVFSDPAGDLVTDVTLTLSKPKGSPMLKVACAAPWVLLKLQPGTYEASARREHPGATARTAVLHAPAHGQAVVNITFPHAPG